MLPEVGDEVLVAFAQGDLGHPYVLGGLYNGQDKPQGGWAANVDGTTGAGGPPRLGVADRHGRRVPREGRRRVRSCVSTNDGTQKVVLTQTAAKGIEIVSEGAV